MSDDTPEPEEKSAELLALERIATALELQAIAAYSGAQHQSCNHLKCKRGAVRLALSEDGKAVVPVCDDPKHTPPELPAPPEPK